MGRAPGVRVGGPRDGPLDVARGAVLVLSADSAMGLAIVRSLGRGGVRVVGATALPDGTGRYSRYCAASVPMPARDDRLADAVLAICDAHGVTDVIATSEETIVALNQVRDRLAPRVRLQFAPADVMDAALHKDRTLALAGRAGLPVPRTVLPAGVASLDACAALGFPLVLKPSHRDPRLPLPPEIAFKTELVADRETLARRLADFERAGAFPLVQEWVPGHGVGVEALFRDGEPVRLFQHRRIHEWPPEGGISVLCESAPLDPVLADHAARLLRAMNWDGVAMVEFRVDDATGRAWLMEVNGRFWGSLPLAIHAGADFPLLLHRSMSGDAAPCGPYRAGVRCRDLVGDTRWLFRVLRTGSHPRFRALLSWLAAFRPSTTYYHWAWDDPRPALIGLFLRARKALR